MIGAAVALTLWTTCPQGMVTVPRSYEAGRLVGQVVAVEGMGWASVGRDSVCWCLAPTRLEDGRHE